MQPYGNYPYYGQQYQHPPYGVPGPSNPYPPYGYAPYGPPPHQQDKEPPFIPQGPGFQPQTPRPKAHRRTATTTAAPLKSALKRPANEGLNRQATYPAAYPNHVPRPRLLSNNHKQYTSNHNPDDFRPLHMFMSFVGNNELRIENVMEPGLRELRSTILPMWTDGVDSDTQHGHDWTVKFRNNPWSFQGPQAPKAWAIIVQLFTLFARRGFSFQTTMSFGNSAPRLVFEVTSEDRTSQFFLAYLSHGGKRLTFIKPPTLIDDTFCHHLKAVLPRKVDEEMPNEHLRVFAVRAPQVEPQFFLMHVLKILTELGFNLATGLPFGRKGPFGLRTGRELLVFRGSVPIDAKG
ncbi:hypothetical protein E4T56_gene3789 [Termitomyces sp. T112]|nr:hypothetical protein E4T56_gene3789 [Termitomyces sp. T112]KAH0590758.1 hypothetical protein H2248_000883 [Termitomyces sp. 'cryptogamus']KNZ77449.1 hypothetical protein J132_05465 [Termitomyces sp. J132]